LCWQLAYELKSLWDAFYHGDDWLFKTHHSMTALLAFVALATGFCLKYAAFFMGISEISTAVVCLLVTFDDKRGLSGLGEKYPGLKILCGAVFAILFILCRVVAWPYVSYFFWRDSLFLLESGAVRSTAVVFLFCGVNALLSVLQVVWLGEIFRTGYELLLAPKTNTKKSA
jgi:hypothetical protein